MSRVFFGWLDINGNAHVQETNVDNWRELADDKFHDGYAIAVTSAFYADNVYHARNKTKKLLRDYYHDEQI
jgi:hypothetical protein